MPILVPVSELELGMCLASNIVNRYSVLLPHGHTISEKDIMSLNRLIPEGMVQVVDPILDQIIEFQDDSYDQNVSRVVRKNVASVVSKVSEQVRSGVCLTSDNIAGMQEVIDEMLRYLRENPVTMALIEQSSGWDDYLQQHSSSVFYLSLVIGNTIRNYIKGERERLSAATYIHDSLNLTPLATASLFHDLGMVPLEYLYRKKVPLTDEEKEKIRLHPHTGADMLPDKIEPIVRQIVRDHHENQNGSGYPQGLPGNKVNIFSRIIRVADAYAAAISDKVYKKGKPSTAVLHEMLHGGYRHFYDPVILKVFASIVPPFPIGAKLKLKNGYWAVVVRYNHEEPFRPKVIIAFDEFGDPLQQDQLDTPFALGSRTGTEVCMFGGEDMSFLNEQAESQDDSILPQSYSELLDFSLP
ncbi:MAG: HD domain-containing protein [Sedimentisphaerales bacterium]|nr:HD domain-containing protein [Sedimentisphaerales bacterium]